MSQPAPSYVLGHDPEELARLERQAAIRHGFSVFFRLMNLKHEMVELRAMRDGLRRRILDLVDRYAPSTLERVIERHEQDVIDL